MSHWVILPVVLPLLAGLVLLLGRSSEVHKKRTISLLATAALLPLSILLLVQAGDGDYRVYALGDWQAPFGIVLVLDRLAALMLLLTAVLSLPALLYALRGDDQRGRHFHALFQFQLMGLNGAFLTGDLFNLFVFFEILLIASYALLLHGGGGARSRAGLHYVLLNLAGSSLFLIAVGVLYGITGTLNMADLAERVAAIGATDAGLLHAAALLLLLVFALKAALLPLYFWLPGAYCAASPPVAALFAIMTKVGVYAIIRIYTLVFGAGAGLLANVAVEWLWPLAMATLLLGGIGALAARSLGRLLAYLMILSSGTLLTGFALQNAAAMSATLYYQLHTTLVNGGLFLLVGIIRSQRGIHEDRLEFAPAMKHPLLPGVLFFIGAAAVVGMPPLSGFVAKLVLLSSVEPGTTMAWLWTIVLAGGLMALIALSRAGSRLFWKTEEPHSDEVVIDRAKLVPAALLVVAAPLLLSLFAGPFMDYIDATSRQLLQTEGYISAVLGGDGLMGGE